MMKNFIKEVEYDKIFSPETMASLKGKSGDSLKQMLGKKSLTQTMVETQEVLNKIIDAEQDYREELAMVATQMVTDVYPIIDYAKIKIEAEIVNMGAFSIEKPSPAEDPASPTFGDEDIEKLEKKRRIINSITQGASIRGAFSFLLFKEYLDNINPDLVEEYNKILKLAFGIYDDENAIALMLSMLERGQKSQGGESEMVYNEDSEQFIIKAKAICFPMLVHEIVKGLYEIVGTEGFGQNQEKNKAIIGAVDKVSNEPDDLRFGKFIYDALSKLYNESNIEDSRVRELFFAEVYKLDENEFSVFIENAVNNKLTNDQKQWATTTMRDIEEDLKKDDTGLEDLGENMGQGSSLRENVKQGKQYVDQGKLSMDELKTLLDADPTSTKKYVGWMAKVWVKEKPDLSTLKNTISEYDVFATRGKASEKDINSYQSFKDLKQEVDRLNSSADALSSKALESDYETLVDDENLLVMSPNTHEASRKIGLAHFTYRVCPKKGIEDSAWCTTFNTPQHFNSYFHKQGYTFMYVRVRSQKLLDKLKEAFPKSHKDYVVMALYFTPRGGVRAQDGQDKELSKEDAKTYLDIVGIA